MKNIKSLYCIILFAFCLNSSNVFSQKIKELEIVGYALPMDFNSEITWGFNIKYNLWINRYIGFTGGVDFNHSRTNITFSHQTETKYIYSIGRSIQNLNGIIGLKFATPTFKNIGLMTDLLFTFEPIPFNRAEIDRTVKLPGNILNSGPTQDERVFTKFNPSYRVEFSLFYQSDVEKPRIRLSAGVGITKYNPYNVYYRTSIDGFKLKDYIDIKPNRHNLIFFIRFTN